MTALNNLITSIFNSSFIKTITDVLQFIISLPTLIIKFLSFIPSEISSLFLPVITIIGVVFIYRFFK